jgi:ZIP family zinc transporter
MIPELHPLLNIALLSLTASLGTGLGGLLAVLRRPGKRSYGLLMGITAGVMLCLSFLSLINKARELAGPWIAMLGFGLGATFMFLLDHFAPHIRFGEKELPGNQRAMENPHPHRRHRWGRHLLMNAQQNSGFDPRLINTGILLAIGITLHNLPEGIAVGASYLHNPRFGLFIATAILLHNIPEGIGTALPLMKGGAQRRDAFRVALLSGFAEPVGAMLASALLVRFVDLVPISLAFAGGVMVFITLDELIPTARDYGHEHFTAIGIILGSLAVFALSALFDL